MAPDNEPTSSLELKRARRRVQKGIASDENGIGLSEPSRPPASRSALRTDRGRVVSLAIIDGLVLLIPCLPYLARLLDGRPLFPTSNPTRSVASTSAHNATGPVPSLTVRGHTIKVGTTADEVFGILTKADWANAPTIENVPLGLRTTHHYEVDGQAFDMVFQRTSANGPYLLTNITVVELGSNADSDAANEARHPPVTVPDFVGERLDNAEHEAGAVGLDAFSAAMDGETVVRESNWVVTAQKPEPGEVVPYGTNIAFVVERIDTGL